MDYLDNPDRRSRHPQRQVVLRQKTTDSGRQRQLGGDWREDPNIAAFPQVPAPAAEQPVVAALSLRALFEAWKAVAVVKPSTVAETGYAIETLAAFLGHDDAARIVRDDLARWRDAQKAEGRTNNTWNNRLSLVRGVLVFGNAEGKLKGDVTEGLRLKKNRTAGRLPYSDDDAVRILKAARLEASPSRRWAHWVMAFSGMRVGEVLQLVGGDIRQDGNIWFMSVNEDAEGKSVKTGQTRHVPLHPRLIEEGFLAYAQTIAPNAPVFPDKPLDQHGRRGGRGWNMVREWVRTTVGITDTQKAPNHSWRHRVEDEMRAAEVPEDARDAITGHARDTTGRLYGVRGEALRRLHRAVCAIPVPDGL